MVELGSGDYIIRSGRGLGATARRLDLSRKWRRWAWTPTTTSIAFNRGEHPMIIFDKDGNFLRSWGEGVYPRAHGITMAPDDTMFLQRRRRPYDPQVQAGRHGAVHPGHQRAAGAGFMSGDPFNRCTHVAIDPRNGDFYVSDGYGNARVHKYSPDGAHLFSWGASGTDPGCFNIAHNVCTDKDGWVFVADRENHRVQVFDSNGKFETQWVNMARPCGLYIDQEAERTYIGELGVPIGPNFEATDLGPRVSIYDTKGNVLARLGQGDRGLKRPGGSSRPTAFASTPGATFTWARCPGPTPAAIPTSQTTLALCKSW